jgi:isopenicillin-N epimerase
MRPYSPASPWRLDPSRTHLNHGSFGACPVPVLEAQWRWRERMEAAPARFLDVEAGPLLEAARERIAAFLGADPEGLAFVPNATTGANTVLASLTFRPGDEILVTDHEYNAVVNAAAATARRDGARVTVARIPFPIASAQAAVDGLLAGITPRTRLAVISHVTSPTAVVLPIDAMVTELDRRGIDTLVDAAHSPGQVPVDLAALGAAYWTGNGHKWLCGPKGSAVLHVRADRRDLIRPLVTSHGANDPRPDRSAFRKAFDWTGTHDPTAALALADAIDLLGSLHPDGWPGLMAGNHALVLRARTRLADALGTAPPVPDELLGAMASVVLPGSWDEPSAAGLGEALAAEDRIDVPVTLWPVRAIRTALSEPQLTAAVRISWQRYVTDDDLERLIDALGARLGAAHR